MVGDGASAADDSEARRLAEEAARVGELARELQDSAANLISRTWNEEQALRQRALALDADLRRLQSSLSAASSRSRGLDTKDAEKLDEELYRARSLISDGDVSSLLPSKTRGRFLRMFLGPINVRATRKDVRLKVKEEYNKYR
ncbi:hypothetical protein Taro_033929, partial [Colocasia esculenta]|nr:hypothetical protein [Colocasia esculenta]